MRMWIVVDIEEDAPTSSTPALIWYFNLTVVQDEILEMLIHLKRSLNMRWKCHDSPSSSCRGVPLKATNINQLETVTMEWSWQAFLVLLAT